MDRFDEMRVKNISGGGGTVIIPPEAGTLTGIAVTKMPTKLDYNEGDSIDLTGLEVTAIYDNNVNGIVTSACTVTVNDPLTVYDTSVLVSYEGFETSFDIKVYGETNIIPSGTEYLFHFEGNLINSITGEVEATIGSDTSYTSGKFYKGISRTIASILNRDIEDRLPTLNNIMSGTASLTIECWINIITSSNSTNLTNNKFMALNGSGSLWRITGGDGYIEMYGLDSKVEGVSYKRYTITTEFVSKGWHHFAWVFSGGYQKLFIDGKKVLSGKCSSSSSTSVINPYFGVTSNCAYDELLISTEALYSADFEPPTNIYGSEKILDKIYFKNPPNKTIYKSGEYFDLSGAKIMAVFSTGAIENVTNECVVENDTPITTSDTFRKISYTYENVTKTVYVNVGAYTIESSVDLSSAKLLMNFDMNTQDLTGINTPTIVGNDNYGVGQFGQARYFSGETELIEFPITSELTIGTSDFTIALWVKFNDVTANHTLVSCCHYINSSTVYQGLNLWINPENGFCFNCDVDETNKLRINTLVKPTANIWYHVALVRKNGIVTLYLDGKNIGSIEANGILYQNSNTMWRIGSTNKRPTNYSNEFLNGYMDDLIISKSALWDSEFTPPSQPFSSIS